MVKKLELDAFLFVIVGAFVGLFLITYVKNQSVQFHSNAEVPQFFTSGPTTAPTETISQTPTQSPIQKSVPTTVPTNAPSLAPLISLLPVTSTTSQISSDGSQKVTIKTIQNRDATTTDEIFTGTMTQPIYNISLNTTESISIPFNTWSPDNTYFYILENSVEGEKILVFHADGSPFGNGQSYLDLAAAYAKYGSNDTFDAATGWAGYNIIVINTKASDGSQGTSYWFEVPDGSIIPLATKF
jgi:hypothetical protein